MGFRSGGGFGGGSRFGGRSGGFRGRDSERRPMQKFDAVCSKCSKECQVPFRPTGLKPVLCSECFTQSGGGSRDFGRSSQSGASSEQMNQINAKLDKIIKILQELEIDVEDEDAEDGAEEVVEEVAEEVAEAEQKAE